MSLDANLWFDIGVGVSAVLSGLITGAIFTKNRILCKQRQEIEEASINPKNSSFQIKHSSIHETLTTLRVRTGADKARIGHFHNGGKFLDGTPMKKFSMTHESCERGVSYDGSNLQNILVTMFWDLVEVMRRDKPTISLTEEMNDGYFRSYLKSNGIVAYAILPIMKQDLYIGFVELEWLDVEKLPKSDTLFENIFVQSKDYIELELAIR